MSAPEPLRFHDFRTADPLLLLKSRQGLQSAPLGQAIYLHDYLVDLKASSVVEEPTYVDHDYLAEFETFYARSTRSHSNTCRRLHFFDGDPVTREVFEAAAAGDPQVHATLQGTYLGFVVLRPIPAAPLGRTVVRLYEDEKKLTTPRVVTTRTYATHLCGLRLEVNGLAWQQQDSAVGACATVALWSLMHSSAFDEHHAIPTTAEVTRLAGRGGLGVRVFPSTGLNLVQIIEAIKGAGLAPIFVGGDLKGGSFSPAKFCGSLASMVRAGFPVLVTGRLVENGSLVGRHAICAVGFRDAGYAQPNGGPVLLQDSLVPHIYVHDDNIGPNVRLAVDVVGGEVVLRRDPPQSRDPAWVGASRSFPYPSFHPESLVVAVPESLRTSPSSLSDAAVEWATLLQTILRLVDPSATVTTSARFISLRDYQGIELPRLLGTPSPVLSRVRLALSEKVPTLSLHLGLVRIALGKVPLVDIVFDTSDSARHLEARCCIGLLPEMAALAALPWTYIDGSTPETPPSSSVATKSAAIASPPA